MISEVFINVANKLENFHHNFSMAMEMNFKVVNFVLSEDGSIQELKHVM